MTKEQRKALQDSIKHWEWNVILEERNIPINANASSCACCNFSRDGNEEIDCTKCPISQYTGELSCYGTPYYAVKAKKVSARVLYDWLVALEKGKNPKIL